MVSEALEKAGIGAVLSGGAAVSIYTDNAYVSRDLDFVSSASLDRIGEVLSGLGFAKGEGRYFVHQNTDFYIEFPAGPLAVGGEILRQWNQLETGAGTLQIITPSQCVMDRLAAFYHWTDPQSLDQAVAVAKSCEVDLDVIQAWSEREGSSDKFQRLLSLVRKS
jgi:hypothetical protein